MQFVAKVSGEGIADVPVSAGFRLQCPVETNAALIGDSQAPPVWATPRECAALTVYHSSEAVSRWLCHGAEVSEQAVERCRLLAQHGAITGRRLCLRP